MTNTMSLRPQSRQDAVLSAPPAETRRHGTERDESGSLALYWIALLSIMLGTWLLISHYALVYPFTEGAEDAFFTEALAGIVLLSAGYGRLQSPWHLPKLTALQALIGSWLITAPWAVGYVADVPMARANGVACGALAVLLAIAGAVCSRTGRRPVPEAPLRAAFPRQAVAPRHRAMPAEGGQRPQRTVSLR